PDLLRPGCTSLHRLTAKYSSRLLASHEIWVHCTQALKALKERDKAIAMVAHDLRGPISAIKGYADLISVDPDPSFQSDGIAAIKRLSDKSINVIESYLDAATSRVEDAPAPDARFSVNKTVLETISELELIHGRIFDFQCGVVDDEVHFDKINFIRALENLAGNAVKYGDVSKRIKISILQKSNDSISVSVRNFGNLLDDLEVKRLLAVGKRTQRAKESGTKGWGLGLDFVKKVLLENSSTLKIRSSVEEGTVFEMVLPVRHSGSKQ
ncbi:MAG: HAMP domain-containing histidine kinase, partial [Proteobacteria bacterium]